MKKIMFISIFFGIFFTSNLYAKVNPKAELTHQEDILLSCLHINYAGIGADLKDYSGNHYTYRTSIQMNEFVKKEAGYFYQKSYPFHLENTPPPYTKIFSECVHFSKSQKVKRFLRTLDLRICKPHSTRNECPE